MQHKIIKIKERFYNDTNTKILTSTYVAFIINIFIGIGKLILALFYSSFWFMIIGSYYLTLAFSRKHIIKQLSFINKMNDSEHKDQKIILIYHKCAFFLIILSVLFLGLNIWMFYFNEEIMYSNYILYGVVAVAFYKIGIACYGLIKGKRQKNLLLSSIKTINVFDACVSIVSIQCALLLSENSNYASSSSALLGCAISIIFIFIAIIMYKKKY